MLQKTNNYYKDMKTVDLGNIVYYFNIPFFKDDVTIIMQVSYDFSALFSTYI